ncbi:MAG: hypothetical protein JXX14_07075, partial [Deltaproteobacteria bacterium]|nr:hypothetical protein [Deltaproteobacteria bacterium]
MRKLLLSLVGLFFLSFHMAGCVGELNVEAPDSGWSTDTSSSLGASDSGEITGTEAKDTETHSTVDTASEEIGTAPGDTADTTSSDVDSATVSVDTA